MYEFKSVNKAKLREKAEKSGITRPYYIREQYPIYKVKEGDNWIRILPPVGEMDDFGLDIWVHGFVGPERGSYLCLERSDIHGLKKKRCVICDVYRKVQGRNDEQERVVVPRRRTLYWILDISDKPQSEDPLVFDAPYRQVAEEILMRCIDRRTGEIIDISDVDEGREIYFRMSRQGRKFPEYKGVELGRVYKIDRKLAKKIVPLYEVIKVPDEVELIEIADFLMEVIMSGEDLEKIRERKEEEWIEKVTKDWGGESEEEDVKVEKERKVVERSTEEEETDRLITLRKRLLEEEEEGF